MLPVAWACSELLRSEFRLAWVFSAVQSPQIYSSDSARYGALAIGGPGTNGVLVE